MRTTDYELNVNQQIPPYPCGVVQEVDRDEGEVPHYLPGTNPYTTEFADPARPADRGHARRRGDDVSGLRAEDEDAAAGPKPDRRRHPRARRRATAR